MGACCHLTYMYSDCTPRYCAETVIVLISMSFRFPRYGQLLVQNRKIFLPPSHLGPSIGVTPMEFWKSVPGPETRVFGTADGEDLMILAWTVFA